ncbi:MAG: hypothetical protein D3909_03340 [Candidatus Electrothrix sp. ATG1]|nr:hypothetical protein [Candidatus Electrothrix sp. ATG1]
MDISNDEKKKIANELLVNFYKEHSLWARHQESQRSIVSNLLTTTSALLIGLITYDRSITASDLPLSIFIFFVGLFGILFVYKYYVQFKFHDNRIEGYKREINSIYSYIDFLEIDKKSDELTKGNFVFLSRLNLYKTWIFFHMLIATAGLILSVIACNN